MGCSIGTGNSELRFLPYQGATELKGIQAGFSILPLVRAVQVLLIYYKPTFLAYWLEHAGMGWGVT